MDGPELPPRIAETEECAQRACLRMADVTVMHSVVIRATGSTATEIGVAREVSSKSSRRLTELWLLEEAIAAACFLILIDNEDLGVS